MEKTLKVDAQKLQILSERIEQTIEALNLVRYSAMGQNHFGGLSGQNFSQIPFQGNYGVGNQINTTDYRYGFGLPQTTAYDYRTGINTFDPRMMSPSFDHRFTYPQYGYGFNPMMNTAMPMAMTMNPRLNSMMAPHTVFTPWVAPQHQPTQFNGQSLSPMAQSWGHYNFQNAPVYGETMNRGQIVDQLNSNGLGQSYMTNPLV